MIDKCATSRLVLASTHLPFQPLPLVTLYQPAQQFAVALTSSSSVDKLNPPGGSPLVSLHAGLHLRCQTRWWRIHRAWSTAHTSCAHIVSWNRPVRSRSADYLARAGRTKTSPLAYTAPSHSQYACSNLPLTFLTRSASITYATYATYANPSFSQLPAETYKL